MGKLQINMKHLRQWQQDAFELWQTDQRGVVQAVTGAGKTVFAIHCIKHFKQRNLSALTAIIVPTITLQLQWTDEIQSSFREAIIASKVDEVGETTEFLIVVINSARGNKIRASTTRDIFIIVDECHRSGSELNSTALQGPWCATLGISATPEREYDDGFESKISPALGEVLYSYDYKQAMQDGVIVPFNLHNVRVPLNDEEQKQYDAMSARIARLVSKVGFEDEQVKSLLRSRARIPMMSIDRLVVAVQLIKQLVPMTTIVFHESLDALSSMKTMLDMQHVASVVYHSKQKPAANVEAIRHFKNGAATVLLTCRAIDEGANVPQSEVAVIVASTASGRQRIQRIGRVLRTFRGKEHADIYTFFATDNEENRLLQECSDFAGTHGISVDWLTTA